jgi:hypothetical protein
MRWLVSLALLLGACDKASVQQCDRGCRNYFTLHFHAETELLLPGIPEAERKAFLEKRAGDLEARMTQQLDLCVQKCRSGANDDRAKCWEKATTTKEAEACKN